MSLVWCWTVRLCTQSKVARLSTRLAPDVSRMYQCCGLPSNRTSVAHEPQASIVCGNVEFAVDNTQKYVPGLKSFLVPQIRSCRAGAKAGYVLHVGQVESQGDLKVGDEVTVKVA